MTAQLSVVLRGLYYEVWHPTISAAVNSRSAHLWQVHDSVHRDYSVDPERVACTAFAMLAVHLPVRKVEDSKAATPTGLHNLWPS